MFSNFLPTVASGPSATVATAGYGSRHAACSGKLRRAAQEGGGAPERSSAHRRAPHAEPAGRRQGASACDAWSKCDAWSSIHHVKVKVARRCQSSYQRRGHCGPTPRGRHVPVPVLAATLGLGVHPMWRRPLGDHRVHGSRGASCRPVDHDAPAGAGVTVQDEHTAVEKRCAKKKSASTRPRASSAVLTSGSIKSPSPPANTVASSRHCATSSGQWTCGMRSSALTLACSRAGAAQGRHPATRRPRWQIADPGPLTRAPWQGHQPAARSCLREYIAVQCGGSIRRRWSAWVGARRAATTRPTSSHPGMLAAAPARPRDERLALGALTSLNSIGEGAIEGGDALVSEHAASPCRRFHGRGTSARGWLSNCPGRCGGRLLHPAASRAGGRRFRLPLPMTPHLSAPGPLRRALHRGRRKLANFHIAGCAYPARHQ